MNKIYIGERPKNKVYKGSKIIYQREIYHPYTLLRLSNGNTEKVFGGVLDCSGREDIVEVLGWSTEPYTKMSFKNCRNLKKLPNYPIPNGTFLNSLSRCFFNCINLESIPSGLFKTCYNTSTFEATFYYCVKIPSIPFGLFDDIYKIKDMSACFMGCTGIRNRIEAIWGKSNITSHFICFRGCVNISNYDEIPNNWK